MQTNIADVIDPNNRFPAGFEQVTHRPAQDHVAQVSNVQRFMGIGV